MGGDWARLACGLVLEYYWPVSSTPFQIPTIPHFIAPASEILHSLINFAASGSSFQYHFVFQSISMLLSPPTFPTSSDQLSWFAWAQLRHFLGCRIFSVKTRIVDYPTSTPVHPLLYSCVLCFSNVNFSLF